MAGQPGRSGGQNRKPNELKRQLGNPGKRPLPAPIVALPPVVRLDAAQRFPDGGAMVQHVLDSGASAWIGPTDLAMLEVARQLYDRLLGAESDSDFVKLAESLNRCLSRLGLDPTARAGLGVAEVKTRTKLEELRARRDARAGRPAG